MNIVVLDGHTLNPGDLSWSELENLGRCVVYDRTPAEAVIERAHRSEILLTNKTVLGKDQIEVLPQLRYIGVLATGYNVVDLATARALKITVTNVPAYSTRSVAQLTFALLLELALHVGHHSDTVRTGKWTASRDFCYWDYPLIELEGLTFGVVGFGRIGRAVADLARCFGMQVLVHTRTPPEEKPPATRFVDLEALFRESDVISLHCPLTSQTERMVNDDRLRLMKKSAFLLNTSRGPLIDEAALARALNEGRIGGAGLDVLSKEPPGANPLLGAKNCVVTPHIGWATLAARARLMKIAVANVKAFLAGQPTNVVS
jgi:glycerate dehydrogenase